MIRVEIDGLLKQRNRSFYWLAKETGVSHTTLWRLKKDQAQGITFNTLERICETLYLLTIRALDGKFCLDRSLDS